MKSYPQPAQSGAPTEESTMSEDPRTPISEIQVDKANLYREELVTDLKVASIRRMVPIHVDGSTDETRPVLYSGETQLMSQAGLVPVHCPIEADSLEEALDNFPEAVNLAVERMVEEAREMQRREASRIVVPGSPGGGMPLPGMGGKIDLK
jgi:hypothetical protein